MHGEKILKRLRSFAAGSADFYTAGVAVWTLFWLCLRNRNGGLALFNAWAFWLLLTGLPAGVASLGRRSRWLGTGWAMALLGLLARRYGWTLGRRRRAIRPPARRAPGADLRILSFNLLNRQRDLAPVLERLHQEEADILLFQELIPESGRQLAQALAYRFCYWRPHPATNMGFGVASRLPFAITGLWDDPGLEPFALRMTFSLKTGPLDVYNVQFTSPTNEVRRLGLTTLLHWREEQVRQVLAAVEARQRPAIVMGDWNTTEGTAIYGQVATRLNDGWIEIGRGPGWTWPRTLNFLRIAALTDWTLPPLLRLDYCFHTPELVVTEMEVVRERLGSDHCPIVARVQLDRAASSFSRPSPVADERRVQKPARRPIHR